MAKQDNVSKRNNRKKFTSRRQSSPAPKFDERKSNSTLSSMDIQTPIGSRSARSLVFPTDCASIQSKGNYVSTPGQSNFFDEWNHIEHIEAPSTTTQPDIVITGRSGANRVASVMVIPFTHYFGIMGQRDGGSPTTSPMAMAALNLKQFIDTSFGTNTNYDPQDLMLYLLGVSAIFPVIAELKRDIRLLVTHAPNQYPQFVPSGILAALEVIDGGRSEQSDLMSITAKTRNYVDQLNQLIVSFNRLPMPPEIIGFGYNDDLFNAVWLDSDSPETAQYYVFQNETYWEYLEEGYDFPILQPWYPESRTFENRIDVLRRMIERLTALRTSATAMLQNLYNAYGSRDTVQVETLDIANLQPVPFIYDPNILTMVENMVPIPRGDLNLGRISADPERNDVVGGLSLDSTNWDQFVESDHINYAVNVPLQFHKPLDQITSEDVGWALRMRVMFMDQADYTSPTDPAGYRLCGDRYVGFAIPRDVRIYRISDNATGNNHYTKYNLYRAQDVVELGTGFNLTWANFARDFKAAPIQVYGAWTTQRPNPITAQFIVYQYTANRDVEATYRLADIREHWVYMTMMVWGTTINRNAPGSRLK